SKTPIIVIPAGSTSLITIYNAKELLQDFKFVSSDEKKKQGARRENEVLIQRRKDASTTVPYRVVDNPTRLQPNEWSIVFYLLSLYWVKIMVLLLLSYYCISPLFLVARGFHLKYDDTKTDPNVQKWDVTILTINRNTRHLDKASINSFWTNLDK
ncbi:predicted protein, partial [Nematostella vectensis]